MNPISKSLVAAVLLCSCIGLSQTIPIIEWDFRDGWQGWTEYYDITEPTVTDEGITFQSIGEDPWIEESSIDLPSDRITRFVVRMKSTGDKIGELLYYGANFEGLRYVSFVVHNDNQWHDYEIVIYESLGAGTLFQLHPTFRDIGTFTVQSIKIESLPKISSVPYQTPTVPIGSNPQQITSGALKVQHYGNHLGNFQVDVDSMSMAVGYQAELLGISNGGTIDWINLGHHPATLNVENDGSFTVRTQFNENGANWTIERYFHTDNQEGRIFVTSRFSVDQDRQVILLPWLTLYAGLETFGSQKYQGLLPGLEYLANEPSSSQKDIVAAEYMRRIPDPIKVTIPMMAISQDERYIGLIWEPCDLTNALFDSPDRVTNMQSHLMGVTGPAVGSHRFENDLFAYNPVTLNAAETFSSTVTLIGGNGKTVVSAVQHYLDMYPLPNLPVIDGGMPAAAGHHATGCYCQN